MLDNHPPAGATPAAGGAMPPQSPPAPPAPPAAPPAPPQPPATGDADGLGDAGKRALTQERDARKAAEDRAKAAEAQLETLRAATQSDSEKAIAAARKEGATEVLDRVHAQVRRAEVRTALTAAGINASVLDLATKGDEFAALKVSDTGDVTGLVEAVAAFKASQPDLFKVAIPGGTADGGARGGGKTIARDQLKRMTPAEINAAFDRGELTGLLKPG